MRTERLMTIKVYAVAPDGTVSPPLAEKTVRFVPPLGWVPPQGPWERCRCPRHRAGGEHR